MYESPLVARNASPEMVGLFSARHRIRTWRRLWVALAESQHELGLPITRKQIEQMKRAMDRIDFNRAARYEKKLRHDVMAHVLAFGDAAPDARGIIHLGATSADITDNADLMILREALIFIRDWLVNVIDALGRFAQKHRGLPTLGFTHFQPAQLTTVGKRATLWCHDFLMDLEHIEFELDHLKFRGLKGATGTQNSFLELFDGSATKVRRLETKFTKKMGFTGCYPVTGQTYSRKVDAQIVNVLSGVATSVHKFCNDIRLLAHLKEIEEPFEKSQVGSSAMPYKRNPMRCERATGLARFVLSLAGSPLQTAAEQWLERTLDDSANRRLSIPEAFLATDGMLRIVTNVARGLMVNEKIITDHVQQELPFLATENVLMAAVKSGGDRQCLHEKLRRYTQAAAAEIKSPASLHRFAIRRPQSATLAHPLIRRLSDDPAFANFDWKKLLDPRKHIGLAVRQTDVFLETCVAPIRRRCRRVLHKRADLSR